LSIGTLQLSIRCSSIHFLPSRSFPVSDRGVFEGKLAAFDVGRSSGLSWADAGHASQIANTETNDGLNQGAMHGLVNLESLGATQKARRLIERCRDQPFHPKPAMRRAVSHPSWCISGAHSSAPSLRGRRPMTAVGMHWSLTFADWARAGALALPADRR
jgi:hypothetical protein